MLFRSAIADCLGFQSLYNPCAAYLREEGIYASVGVKNSAWTYSAFAAAVWKMQLNAFWPRSTWLGGSGRTYRGISMMQAPVEMMEKLAAMLADGKVKVVIDSVWDMEDALEGYRVMESMRARGKIVIKVQEEVDL